MRSAWLVVAMAGAGVWDSAARAETLPAPIAVKTVRLPSPAAEDNPAWKLLMPSGATWCQANPGTNPGEPLAIALASPAAISSVGVAPMNDSAANPITTAEVVADGKSFKGTRARDASEIDVKLSGAPVTQLVIRVAASGKGSRDVNCVSEVHLHTTPGAIVLYGIEPAAAAALWPSVLAARDALRTCNARALAAQLAFPFETSWSTMDNDGMKDRSAKYRTAAAAAKACKAKQLRGAYGSMKLVEPRVDSQGPGKLEVSEGGTNWSLELDGDHWRVRSISEGPG